MTPFFAAILSAAADHDQSDSTDADGLREAYDRARRNEAPYATDTEYSAIEDPTGVLLAPTADIRLTKFANATIATPDGGEWIKSSVVYDREAMC